MYTKLKQDMRNAGISVSDGDDLAGSDLQLVRDFLYFRGINIGENFHTYEEVVHGLAVGTDPTIVPNEEVESVQELTDESVEEPVQEPVVDQESTPSQDPIQEPAADQEPTTQDSDIDQSQPTEEQA